MSDGLIIGGGGANGGAGGGGSGGAAEQGAEGEVPFLGEMSPNGNLQVIVQDDGRTVYMYLAGPEESEFGVRAVWVRNRVAAPAEWSPVEGEPPMLPAHMVKHPAGQPEIDREKAGFIWLPEGSGVALVENGEILAAIVPWSGLQGFPGYARDVVGQAPAACAFPEDHAVEARFAAADEFWKAWSTTENPWPKLQEQIVMAYRPVLGTPQQVYAIDRDTWPPKAMLKIPGNEGLALVTCGVSLRPQPVIDPVVPEPRAIRRVEFGIMLPKNANDQDLQRYGSLVVGLADLPWSRYAWLQEGNAIPTDGLEGTPYVAVVLANSRNFGPKVVLPDWEGDPVNLLWLIPVTQPEMERIQKNGSLANIDYPRGPRLIVF